MRFAHHVDPLRTLGAIQRDILAAFVSGWGQSRRFNRPPLTSGLARSADIFRIIRHVSKVSETDIALSKKIA